MIETLMSPERPANAQTPPPAPKQIASSELLAGQKEVWILHGQETYRLRLTRSGKLILQK
jgi:hemin uptake protein HemP